MTKPPTWSPGFETGIAEIDGDHRALFAMVDDIYQLVEKQEAELTSAKIQAFIDLAERHFAREEEILAEAGFPEISAHKRYHASLLMQAKELALVCHVEPNPERARICYEELLVFLIDDVVRGDLPFKSYLNHKGLSRGRISR